MSVIAPYFCVTENPADSMVFFQLSKSSGSTFAFIERLNPIRSCFCSSETFVRRTTSCVRRIPPGFRTLKYSFNAFCFSSAWSMVSMASFITTSKVLSPNGSSMAFPLMAFSFDSSFLFFMASFAISRNLSSRSIPVTSQPNSL